MLTIKPYTSADSLPQFEAGRAAGALYFVAQAGGELLGFLRYRKAEDAFLIEEIDAGGDEALFDGLMRVAFDAAVHVGVDRARFAPGVDRAVLQALSVPLEADSCVNSLRNFLNNCRNCKKSG